MKSTEEVSKSVPTKCPFCQTENYTNPLICRKCGGELVYKPFWTTIQLKECTNFKCKNKVHFRSSNCPVCKEGQNKNLIRKAQDFLLLLLSSIFAPKNEGISIWQQIMMYLGIALGVLFSNDLRIDDQSTEQLPEGVLIALLSALLLMPSVFERVSFNPKTPFIIRFGLYFQSGVFADVLIAAIQTNL